MKGILEAQHPKILVAGDAGYVKSKVLVIPFTNDEAMADPRLLNLCHSGMRSKGKRVYLRELEEGAPYPQAPQAAL